MNVCDTSFEGAKTVVLLGGDFLDCISVPMEKIRLLFVAPDVRVYWIIVKVLCGNA